MLRTAVVGAVRKRAAMAVMVMGRAVVVRVATVTVMVVAMVVVVVEVVVVVVVVVAELTASGIHARRNSAAVTMSMMMEVTTVTAVTGVKRVTIGATEGK